MRAGFNVGKCKIYRKDDTKKGNQVRLILCLQILCLQKVDWRRFFFKSLYCISNFIKRRIALFFFIQHQLD